MKIYKRHSLIIWFLIHVLVTDFLKLKIKQTSDLKDR